MESSGTPCPASTKEETKIIGQPFGMRIGKLGDPSLCGPRSPLPSCPFLSVSLKKCRRGGAEGRNRRRLEIGVEWLWSRQSSEGSRCFFVWTMPTAGLQPEWGQSRGGAGGHNQRTEALLGLFLSASVYHVAPLGPARGVRWKEKRQWRQIFGDLGF